MSDEDSQRMQKSQESAGCDTFYFRKANNYSLSSSCVMMREKLRLLLYLFLYFENKCPSFVLNKGGGKTLNPNSLNGAWKENFYITLSWVSGLILAQELRK